jgi:hypothetical protein
MAPIPFRLLAAGALLAGCAEAPRAPDAANLAEYYRDGQRCRNDAAVKQKIRMVYPGSPGYQEIETHTQPDRYRRCMESYGWIPETGTEQLLAVQKECHDRAARPPAAVRNAAGTRLTGDHDEAAYLDCLRSKGFEGDVTVEPLQPVEPAPKHP